MQPAGTYIVVTPVEHDGQRYEPRDVFSVADDQVVADLRQAGAVKLREEIEAAEQLAADRARVEAENAALRQQLNEANAKIAALAQQGGKGGKGVPTSPAV